MALKGADIAFSPCGGPRSSCTWVSEKGRRGSQKRSSLLRIRIYKIYLGRWGSKDPLDIWQGVLPRTLTPLIILHWGGGHALPSPLERFRAAERLRGWFERTQHLAQTIIRTPEQRGSQLHGVNFGNSIRGKEIRDKNAILTLSEKAKFVLSMLILNKKNM